jgi:hypothetical protein
LEEDECWICGASEHAAYECGKRVYEIRLTGKEALQ